MTDLVAHIREVIVQHAKCDSDGDEGFTCGCGATCLADHSGHVAQEIINRLGLRRVGKDFGDQVRYVSALFDGELTVLEGAQ